MKKIRAVSFVITIFIMALIFFFSSQNSDKSTEVSDGITIKIVETVSPGLPQEKKAKAAEDLRVYVRKTAHFTLFASLGAAAFATIKANGKTNNKRAAAQALAIAVLYACSDEIHQIFISGRTAMITDVLIDSAGALTGIGVIFLLYRLFCKHKIKKERFI